MAIYNYESEKLLRSIPKTMHDFHEGDTAVIAPEHKVLTFHEGDWCAPAAGKLNISLMELNESLMEQQPDYKKSDFIKFKRDISDNFCKADTYMFIQHDYHYVTLFLRDDEKENENFYNLLVECIKNIGEMKGYEIRNDYVEIWIKNRTGVKMYLLFPYEEGCVYYHG